MKTTSGPILPARLLAAIGLVLLCGAGPALAFSFNINPVSLSLSGKKRPSALLRLESPSAAPVSVAIASDGGNVDGATQVLPGGCRP